MFAEITSKINRYIIANSVLDEIKSTLRFPEMGGILGSNTNKIITDYHHDITGQTTARNYTPDINKLNNVILQWHLHGIEFIGFVHSHPKGYKYLSPRDFEYANEIKKACEMSEILMLIIFLKLKSSINILCDKTLRTSSKSHT